MQNTQTHTNASDSLLGSFLHGPRLDALQESEGELPCRAGGDGNDGGSDGDDDSNGGGVFSITPITISLDTDFLDVEYTPPFDLDVEWGDAARDQPDSGNGNSGFGGSSNESPNPH